MVTGVTQRPCSNSAWSVKWETFFSRWDEERAKREGLGDTQRSWRGMKERRGWVVLGRGRGWVVLRRGRAEAMWKGQRKREGLGDTQRSWMKEEGGAG